MSVLLVAINSKYSHTNLAVRSIANYVKSNLPKADIHFDEWTIQEPILDILRGINAYKPDVVIFSVYIWNCTQCYAVAKELKKIMPNILIGMGGPEVSYKDPDFFAKNSEVDFIVKGEGELLTLELCKILSRQVFSGTFNKANFPMDFRIFTASGLSQIPPPVAIISGFEVFTLSKRNLHDSTSASLKACSPFSTKRFRTDIFVFSSIILSVSKNSSEK